MRFVLAVVALASFACAPPPTPERQIVDAAATALGGAARVEAVKTIVLEGDGSAWNLGQDVTPDATGQTYTVTEYKRAIDIEGRRVRTEQTRTPAFPYFAGQQPQKQVGGVDGEVGYNVQANGTATRASAAAAKDRLTEMYHHPLTAVRAALGPGAQLRNPRTEGGEQVVDVITPAGVPFTLAIDGTTKLPTRVVSTTDNANLGDVAIETRFAEYQDVNGLKLPSRLTTNTDKWKTAEVRVKSSIDGSAGDLAAPAAAASAPVAAAPPAPVTVTELGKGVWVLGGGYNSVLIEFKDHLTLIESPQNDGRALAVIAKARELRPDKPLTHVVNTHHHFDHSGGVRAAVSEGLTIITQKANAAFYEDIVSRKHTMVPDALAKAPKPLKIETVDDELELKDETMTVNLYRLVGSPHADTLLMAYFPRERVLVEADVYNVGAPVQPFAANFIENVTNRKLRVDKVVPVHGTITPYADIVKGAAAN